MVCPEIPQTLVDGRHEARSGVVGDPDLRGDENLVPWNLRHADRGPDVGLVPIHLRGVDMAKAVPKRGDEDALKQRARHAVGPEAEDRDVRVDGVQRRAGGVRAGVGRRAGHLDAAMLYHAILWTRTDGLPVRWQEIGSAVASAIDEIFRSNPSADPMGRERGY
jgi:hypothetical protein